MTMKMIRSTRSTSIRGVTFISGVPAIFRRFPRFIIYLPLNGGLPPSRTRIGILISGRRNFSLIYFRSFGYTRDVDSAEEDDRFSACRLITSGWLETRLLGHDIGELLNY